MSKLQTLFYAFILLLVPSVTKADQAAAIKNKELNVLAVELINGLENYCGNFSIKFTPGKMFCSRNQKANVLIKNGGPVYHD